MLTTIAATNAIAQKTILVVDISGSMGSEIGLIAKTLQSTFHGAKNVVVFEFNSKARQTTLDKLGVARGGTDLTEAVLTLIEYINADKSGVDCRIIFISDGEDPHFTRSNAWVMPKLKARGRRILFTVMCVGERCAFDALVDDIHGMLDTGNGLNQFFVAVDRNRSPEAEEELLAIYKAAVEDLMRVEHVEVSLKDMKPGTTVAERRAYLAGHNTSTLRAVFKCQAADQAAAHIARLKTLIGEITGDSTNRALKLIGAGLIKTWESMEEWMIRRQRPLSEADSSEKGMWTKQIATRCTQRFGVASAIGNTTLDPYQAVLMLAAELKSRNEGAFVDAGAVLRCPVSLEDEADVLSDLTAMLCELDGDIRGVYPDIGELYNQTKFFRVVCTLDYLKTAVIVPWTMRVKATSWETPCLSQETVVGHRSGKAPIHSRENISRFSQMVPLSTCPRLFGSNMMRNMMACELFGDSAISPQHMQLAFVAALVRFRLDKGGSLCDIQPLLTLVERTYGSAGCYPNKPWIAYVECMGSDSFMEALMTANPAQPALVTPDLNKALLALLLVTPRLDQAALKARLEGFYVYHFHRLKEPAFRAAMASQGADISDELTACLGPILAAHFLPADARRACDAALAGHKHTLLDAALAQHTFKGFAALVNPEAPAFGAYDMFGYSPAAIHALFVKALGFTGPDPVWRSYMAAHLLKKGNEDKRAALDQTAECFLGEKGGFPAMVRGHAGALAMFHAINYGVLATELERWFAGAWAKHMLQTHCAPMLCIPPAYLERYYTDHAATPEEERLVVTADGVCKNACFNPGCRFFGRRFGTVQTSVSGKPSMTSALVDHIAPVTIPAFHKTIHANPQVVDPMEVVTLVLDGVCCDPFPVKNKDIVARQARKYPTPVLAKAVATARAARVSYADFVSLMTQSA